MKAIAVIGAAFGDEGKGRMVHYFSSQTNDPAIVVRYNGGAQAGHTVVRDDGLGYIFHHFGSGTLVGTPTYLSRFFITNPLLWHAENNELHKLSINPILFVHPDAPVSTPYDMLLNRETELQRGTRRHGSCGYGINETVHRLCESEHPLFVRDIGTFDFKRKVEAIRSKYIPQRLAKLKIASPSKEFQEALASPALLDEFLYESSNMLSCAGTFTDYDLRRFPTVIFEGAQGLGLDEKHKFFPHVTRSKTGLANIVNICKGADINGIEAVYVTRTYTTRHGAGPFPTEVIGLQYIDRTNVKNDWQGSLRFGHLDIDLIKDNVKKDLHHARKLNTSVSIAITCLDQVDDPVTISFQHKVMQTSRENICLVAASAIGATKVYRTSKP